MLTTGGSLATLSRNPTVWIQPISGGNAFQPSRDVHAWTPQNIQGRSTSFTLGMYECRRIHLFWLSVHSASRLFIFYETRSPRYAPKPTLRQGYHEEIVMFIMFIHPIHTFVDNRHFYSSPMTIDLRLSAYQEIRLMYATSLSSACHDSNCSGRLWTAWENSCLLITGSHDISPTLLLAIRQQVDWGGYNDRRSIFRKTLRRSDYPLINLKPGLWPSSYDRVNSLIKTCLERH